MTVSKRHTLPICLSVIGLIGCEPVGPVEIGVLLSQSRELGSYTTDVVDGIYMAVDEINQRGGVLYGRPLQLVFEDDYSDSQSLLVAYDALIEREVSAIIGPYFSSSVMSLQTATNPQIIRGGTLTISGSTTVPALSELEDNDFFFRTIPPDQVQALLLVDMISNAKLDYLCIVYRKDAWAEKFRGIIVEELPKALQEEIEIDGFGYDTDRPVNPSDMTSNNNCDGLKRNSESLQETPGIVLFTFAEDGHTLLDHITADMTTLNSNLMPENILFVEGNKSESMFLKLGVQANSLAGARGTAPSGPAKEEDARGTRVAGFQERFGEFLGEDGPLTIGVNTDMYYDATYLVAAAIQIAGDDTDRVGIRDALKLHKVSAGWSIAAPNWDEMRDEIIKNGVFNYQGVSGEVDFNRNGDPCPPYFVSEWKINESGKIVETNQVYTYNEEALAADKTLGDGCPPSQ